MPNNTSVFPVVLLENAVTRPICISRLHIKAKKHALHLSDEPMKLPLSNELFAFDL